VDRRRGNQGVAPAHVTPHAARPQRTRTKNEVSAVLVRNLIARPDVSDLFGKAGRQWMATLVLPVDEQHTLAGCLRQDDFLSEELSVIDRAIAERVLASHDMRRLLTIPGVDATTAATMMATIGRIGRFPTPRQLVGEVGLDGRVRQSGSSSARHGRISKQGTSAARHVLVQAAWAAIKPGPLNVFYRRVKARRGAQIAIVAVARKLTILNWHLLIKQQDYQHQRPVLVDRKLRRLELQTGAPRRPSPTHRGPEHRPARPTARAPRRSRLHGTHHRLDHPPTPHLTFMRRSSEGEVR
jgi:transposase